MIQFCSKNELILSMNPIKRRRYQRFGAILMALGVVFNVYRFLTDTGSWINTLLAVTFLFFGLILFLQSKDIIKTRD